MDVSYLQQSSCIISPPIRSSTRCPPSVLFGASALTRNQRNGGPFRRRNVCLASSSDTLVAGKSPEIVSKKEDEIADLKYWMHQNGLPPCKVYLKDRPSHDAKLCPIHYVAASEDLQAADIAFSVPNSLVVTLERVLGNETVAELLTTNKLSELACLALYLMYEKKQGKKSFWYPYIRELDRQRGRGQLAVESPLLWSEAELSYLTGSPTKAEVLERAEGIRTEYNELDTVWFMAGSLFQQYPYDIPTEAFPFEIFKQAFVAIQSCVVHLQKVSLARRFALVPLGPPLLSYRSNCKAMLTAADDAVQLVVDRPYKVGDPIVVWCGPQPNSKLLINYGFVDEDNSYDRIVIEAALNTEDPQYQDKRLVAQRNGKLSVQVFHVNVGKERAAVFDMLPYLRLGYVSDPSEMQSVISSQGPICPVSPCMEKAVLDQLTDYFRTRLAGYPTTLSEDEYLLADSSFDAKKRVATRLVRLEKKVLSTCLQVAVDLISQLPDAVQLVVDRPYKVGDPIVVWCGPQPNSKLLINYGFVDEDNSYDRIVIEAALNTEDPQYQDKRLVAQRNGKLSVQVFHVNVGKERAAVFDMLPYLRLGYVSDPSEMQSVISSQGPICPVSPCMEKAVLDQLTDYFRTRLAGYPTTLSEDEYLLADSSFDAKKRVATRLVRLEKKVLSTCLQVAVDLISQLPDAVQLVVDRPYKVGDPIVVWCGPQPNSKLLINYGFVDEDNSYDRIVIEAALNTEDPQYQNKRLVAQRNGKLSVQVFHVNVGKERAAVFDMLPYLRLGYVSDPSEMQSVISSQGPICPVSPCMEKAVLDQLTDYFRTRLAGYPTTLSEDEYLLADSSFDAKKRVATRLVRLEKKVLSTCLQVAVDLISQLPDNSVSPCPAPYAPVLK